MAGTIFDVPYKDPATDSTHESIMVHDLRQAPGSTTKQVPVPQLFAKELPLYLIPLSTNVKTEIQIVCPEIPNLASFADAINQLPEFAIGIVEIPTFKSTSTGAIPIIYYIELLGVGAGNYGVAKTQLTVDNIKVTSFADSPARGFVYGRLSIFKHHTNVDPTKIDILEIKDVAAGWLTNTMFLPFGQFKGGDPALEANWDGSPFTFI